MFNAHTEPLFKSLNILKISDIFDKQYLKFYHKFCSDMLPVFFNNMYIKHGHIHQHDTRQRDEISNSATRLIMTEKCVRHYIPELLCKTPNCITDKFDSHSLQGFSLYVEKYLFTKYANECTIRDCYVCKNWYSLLHTLILASRIVSIQDDAYVFEFATHLVHVNINNSL